MDIQYLEKETQGVKKDPKLSQNENNRANDLWKPGFASSYVLTIIILLCLIVFLTYVWHPRCKFLYNMVQRQQPVNHRHLGSKLYCLKKTTKLSNHLADEELHLQVKGTPTSFVLLILHDSAHGFKVNYTKHCMQISVYINTILINVCFKNVFYKITGYEY